MRFDLVLDPHHHELENASRRIASAVGPFRNRVGICCRGLSREHGSQRESGVVSEAQERFRLGFTGAYRWRGRAETLWGFLSLSSDGRGDSRRFSSGVDLPDPSVAGNYYASKPGR